MTLSAERLRAALTTQLTGEELASCVVYIAGPLAAGTRLEFPQLSLVLPWEGFVAFVDLDPMANWGHACRYVLMHAETGESKTVNAQLPPFSNQRYRWRVFYQASSVADALLAVAKS
jgi:hypothetical protein